MRNKSIINIVDDSYVKSGGEEKNKKVKKNEEDDKNSKYLIRFQPINYGEIKFVLVPNYVSLGIVYIFYLLRRGKITDLTNLICGRQSCDSISLIYKATKL